MKKNLIFFLALLTLQSKLIAQVSPSGTKCNVLAYYTGDADAIDKFNVSELTHIIFSFTHLQGNSLHIDKAKDSVTIRKLVSLKKQYPGLKIIFSLGGWGGCETCSAVFNTADGRREFASSAKHLLQYFGADGIDLDWEYPAISGFPGHQFLPQDKENFTALIAEVRKQFGKKYEVSFAAGGFTDYILKSVEWSKVTPLVDRINLMTYDLVNGFSTKSGHHTPLYSTLQQKESIANAVYMLDSIGVPKNKMVVGAAFYARIFKLNDTLQNGLYQPCVFYKGVDFNQFNDSIVSNPNYVYHWDSIAHAPYYFNAKEKMLVSFDNKKSMAEKTKYVMDNGLDGIMFWELTNDVYQNGLLQAIDDARNGKAVAKAESF